jgi:predicted DNA-binding transcriptional regulator
VFHDRAEVAPVLEGPVAQELIETRPMMRLACTSPPKVVLDFETRIPSAIEELARQHS